MRISPVISPGDPCAGRAVPGSSRKYSYALDSPGHGRSALWSIGTRAWMRTGRLYHRKWTRSPSSSAGDGFAAAFVAYSLIRYGHSQVCILDGGFHKWQQENRQVTQESGRTSRVAYTAHIREDYFIGYSELSRLKDQPGVVLLDTRPLAAYEGQASWAKPGHIPGSINIPARVTGR